MQTQYIAKNARISTRGWSLDSLTSSSRNFCAVDRVPASSSELLQVIKDHERTGLPLVIEGLHKHENWPAKMFTIEGFEECSESSDISVRDVHSWTDKVMNFSDFVLQSRSVSSLAEEGENERLYGKDAECPHAWEKWLQESNVLPSCVLSHGKEDEFRFRPASSRIETLMCYLGVGDTYTPCHKDLCASSGQNLMCYTEESGSSFWFMTESSSAPRASTYFHQLGQELDHENHVITIEQLRRAPFKIYILEQRLGDLVLVPPRSCHQVVNYGGITLKTSWSRMTLTGLSTAYHHELPIYRRVGRPETYRIKSTIYHALTSRTKELRLRSQLPGSPSSHSFPQELVNAINSSANNHMSVTPDPEIDSLVMDLTKLLDLYDLILAEEKPGLGLRGSQRLDSTFNDDNRIVCDFCECDIFQSFFECSRCMGGSSSGLIVCPGCYSEGRSCRCGVMEPMQCRKFQTLIDTRKEAADVLRSFLGKMGGNDTHLSNQRQGTPARLFQAACLLFQAQKDTKKPTRVCSRVSNHYDSHEVPFAWGLHCQQCHRSSCFEHILKSFKMHSAEAVLLFELDRTRMHYHQEHRLSSSRYGDSLRDVERTQKEGLPTDGVILLAHIALQYGHCVPSNLKSLRHGWYDPVEEEARPSHSDKPKFTITIPAPDKRFSATQSRSRRTEVYVDVPPSPYLIPRKLSEIEAIPSEEVHRPSSEPREASPSTTKDQNTLSTSLRPAVEPNFESPTSFKSKPNLTNTGSTSSISPPVVTGKKDPRSPQHASVQCESSLSQKYWEAQAAKTAVYHQMHFKKKPDDDSSAMISTPDVPDVRDANPSRPSQGAYSRQKYWKAQAAKKAVYHRMHFKKEPDDESSAMISTPNVPDVRDANPSSPPQGEYSRQKYWEAQAAKNAVYRRMHFKKKPDDDSSAVISTPNVPDVGDANPSSPPQGEYSPHPRARFVPPQEEFANSARQLYEMMNTMDLP